LVGLLVATSMVGCRNLEHPARLGVEAATMESGIIVHFRSCRADARVTHVRLSDAMGTRGDGSDDVVLWEAEGAAPAFGSVEIGQDLPAVSGLLVIVPFDENLDLNSRLLRLTVVSTSLPAGESFSFSPADLRADSVLTKDGNMTVEEFSAPVKCG